MLFLAFVPRVPCLLRCAPCRSPCHSMHGGATCILLALAMPLLLCSSVNAMQNRRRRHSEWPAGAYLLLTAKLGAAVLHAKTAAQCRKTQKMPQHRASVNHGRPTDLLSHREPVQWSIIAAAALSLGVLRVPCLLCHAQLMPSSSTSNTVEGEGVQEAALFSASWAGMPNGHAAQCQPPQRHFQP